MFFLSLSSCCSNLRGTLLPDNKLKDGGRPPHQTLQGKIYTFVWVKQLRLRLPLMLISIIIPITILRNRRSSLYPADEHTEAQKRDLAAISSYRTAQPTVTDTTPREVFPAPCIIPVLETATGTRARRGKGQGAACKRLRAVKTPSGSCKP